MIAPGVSRLRPSIGTPADSALAGARTRARSPLKIVQRATALGWFARWRRASSQVCTALGRSGLLSSRSRVRVALGAPPAKTWFCPPAQRSTATCGCNLKSSSARAHCTQAEAVRTCKQSSAEIGHAGSRPHLPDAAGRRPAAVNYALQYVGRSIRSSPPPSVGQ
jgi:hypothetical protein